LIRSKASSTRSAVKLNRGKLTSACYDDTLAKTSREKWVITETQPLTGENQSFLGEFGDLTKAAVTIMRFHKINNM